MSYKPYKKNKRVRTIKKIAVLTLIICSLFGIAVTIYIVTVINPVLVRIASARVDADVTIAVNKAIAQALDGPLEYTDLITIHKDSGGKIRLLQANSAKINQIAVATATNAQQNIDKISGQIIKIPVGSATGAPIFVGFGPEINISVHTAGSVKVDFKSEFQGAGLNQTRHKIYLNVEVNLQLVLPVQNQNITSTVQVFISESILVGDVPQFFFSPSSFVP